MSGPTEPWTPADLLRFVEQNQIQAELLFDLGHTPTVPAAAAALGVAPDQIVKTLLFLVEQPGGDTALPIVVISYGERRVDKGRLAERFGVGKKRVVLAPAPVVLATLGYPAGGVPPFGHRTPVPAILDASMQQLRPDIEIFAGGGDDQTMMRLQIAELMRVTQAELLAVS